MFVALVVSVEARHCRGSMYGRSLSLDTAVFTEKRNFKRCACLNPGKECMYTAEFIGIQTFRRLLLSTDSTPSAVVIFKMHKSHESWDSALAMTNIESDDANND